MDITENLKYNIDIFKIGGLLEMEDHPSMFRIYSISLFTIFMIIFPVSLAINVFYVDTVEAVIKHSFVTISVWMVSVKALVVILNRIRIKELMRLMNDINLGSKDSEYNVMFRKTRDECQRLITAFLVTFMTTCTCLTIVTILAVPAERVWPSTILFPIESLHHPVIYNTVLIFQALSNGEIGIVLAALDSYGIALMHSLRSLLHILGIRLRQMGLRTLSIDNERELIALCKEYEKLLR